MEPCIARVDSKLEHGPSRNWLTGKLETDFLYREAAVTSQCQSAIEIQITFVIRPITHILYSR
jgi:hypothetical protein